MKTVAKDLAGVRECFCVHLVWLNDRKARGKITPSNGLSMQNCAASTLSFSK